MRSSTKIVIGAALVAAVGYVGLVTIPGYLVMREKFSPLKPGSFNIVGVNTRKGGYTIVVANQVAQLVVGKAGNLEAPDPQAVSSSERKRVPLRDMIRALQGDDKSLARFVMLMNDISDASLPAYPIVWKAEDIERALSGDEALKRRLVEDLAIGLDGVPLDSIRTRAIQEGIVVETPVPIRVNMEGKEVTRFARIREEYRPRFFSALDRELSEKGNLTTSLIAGYYRAAARDLIENPSKCEDIAASLRSRYAKTRVESLASLPQRMLGSITIVVNDSLIDGARAERYKTSDGKPMSDLVLVLADEGRRRLWQYSSQHKGEQLLLVWEGIAVAAPTIVETIPFAEVQIKQIPDSTLAQDTVKAILKLSSDRKNKT